MTRMIQSPIFAAMIAVAASCAGAEKTARAPERPSTTTVTSAAIPGPPAGATQPVSPQITVSEEIAQKCRLSFGEVEQAPKFDFDSVELGLADRDALAQIARCLVSGPLAGRKVELVGRTDPRGTAEYNMALGERRADSVATYLKDLGVGGDRLHETSRGELDATGTDEASWAKDRRVDVLLAD